MKESSKKKTTLFRTDPGSFLAAVFCVFCAVFLIVDGQTVSKGVVSGIELCLKTVIPSLFCFMVLTGFLLQSGLYRLLSVPLSPITKHLFFLPPELGSVVLLSLIGGYPMGAKSIADLLNQHRIEPGCAQRMLLYCCCAGPSFIITAVGYGMFGSYQAGFVLYLVQLITSLIFAVVTGVFARRKKQKQVLACFAPANTPKPFLPFGQAFVSAVSGAVSSLAQMCGFIILFRAVSEAAANLFQNRFLSCILLGSLEVTNGCLLSGTLPLGILFASCFLSFGGFSVIAQLAGFLKDTTLSTRPFLAARALHAVCSSFLVFCYLKLFPQTAAVFSSSSQPLPISNENTPLLTGCLIMMSILFLFELSQNRYNTPYPMKNTKSF